jgi:dTDP-4-dehydrorhamnose reductase
MLGRVVCDHCQAQGDTLFAYDHQALDISDSASVLQAVQNDKPDVIINCAAWTDVDGCELDNKRAFAVNAFGPENLANASRAQGSLFVTVSTDYVFDGAKDGFYTQRDHPVPISVYGVSKLEGEYRAQRANADTIIVRTGFVFGPKGRNFLSTIVDRARRGEKIAGISDAYGTPTYAPHLAVRLRLLAELALPGTFHVVNSGPGVSYEDFARVALAAADFDAGNLQPVKMSSLHRPALRPRNSRLKCLLSEAIGLPPLQPWEDAVREFVALDTDDRATAHN